MRVRVSYHAQLRSAIGRPSDDVELVAGASVLTLLEQLASRADDNVCSHLFASPAVIRPSLLVVLNNAPLPHALAATTQLKDADSISLLPPIAGG